MKHLVRLAIVALLTVLLLQPPVTAVADDNSTRLDGIDIVAVANYSCGPQQVLIRPTTLTPVNGNYPVWMFGWVYSYSYRQWLASPGWYRVDGITALAFNVGGPPYQLAGVRFAISNNGRWDYADMRVVIQGDLDNAPPFCN